MEPNKKKDEGIQTTPSQEPFVCPWSVPHCIESGMGKLKTAKKEAEELLKKSIFFSF
ncbi:hypothetical protein MASR1M31_01230 [Porphyromonadaceae bacterium]